MGRRNAVVSSCPRRRRGTLLAMFGLESALCAPRIPLRLRSARGSLARFHLQYRCNRRRRFIGHCHIRKGKGSLRKPQVGLRARARERCLWACLQKTMKRTRIRILESSSRIQCPSLLSVLYSAQLHTQQHTACQVALRMGGITQGIGCRPLFPN